MTIVLAGHETTALALSWALLLLSQNPAALDQLVIELDAELEGRAPTLDDVPRLVFTTAVLQETMRLYPPIFGIGREAINEVDLNGRGSPTDTSTTTLPNNWWN